MVTVAQRMMYFKRRNVHLETAGPGEPCYMHFATVAVCVRLCVWEEEGAWPLYRHKWPHMPRA